MCQGDSDDAPEVDPRDPMQLLIGQQLKAVYNEVLEEPIPERLLSLLDQLDQVTADDSRKGS